jgi:hypothetical protein
VAKQHARSTQGARGQCTKATFFPIGLHATCRKFSNGLQPDTIGSHTWCHQDLMKTSGTLTSGKRMPWDGDAKAELEKGISAVQ